MVAQIHHIIIYHISICRLVIWLYLTVFLAPKFHKEIYIYIQGNFTKIPLGHLVVYLPIYIYISSGFFGFFVAFYQDQGVFMVFSITFEGGMPLMLCCFFLFNLAHLRVVIALFPNPFELRGWDFTLGPTKSWKLLAGDLRVAMLRQPFYLHKKTPAFRNRGYMADGMNIRAGGEIKL